MNLPIFKNKKLYTIQEITSHVLGIEAELDKDYERTLQRIALAKDEKSRKVHEQTLALIADNKLIAHEALNHMLHKFSKSQS